MISLSKPLSSIPISFKNSFLSSSSNSDNSDSIFAHITTTSAFSFEAYCCAIEDYIDKIKQNECDIILSKMHSAKDGFDAVKIMTILTKG